MAAVRVRHDAPYHAAQVQACLATVVDPELDESVTELGFITEVELPSEGEVRVGFRLPTFWCAANFAFLMADDMRRALLELPWVTKVDVQKITTEDFPEGGSGENMMLTSDQNIIDVAYSVRWDISNPVL